MPDGTITFRTDLDNAKLEKDLAKVTKKIETTEGRLSKKTETQSGIKIQLDAAKEAARQTEIAIESLKKEQEQLSAITSGANGAATTDPTQYVSALERQKEIATELKEQSRALADQDKAVERLDAKYTKATDDVNCVSAELNQQKMYAAELSEQLDQCGKPVGKLDTAVGDVSAGFGKLTTRISGLAARTLVFSTITSGLNSLKSYLGDVITANDEASAAVGRLKGALLTMAQPLLQVVIPELTTLVNLLTTVVGKIASFVAALTGTTAAEAADAAKALNKEASALGSAGSAAEEASKQLMGFDEINRLESTDSSSSGGGGSSGSIEPDFSWADSVSEDLERIADYVLLIAAGFALWKISELIPGTLGDILGKLGLILMAVGFLLIAWDGLKDAWENGVDWGNMAEMIGGVAGAAVALYLAFGKIGAGIALVVGGAAMIVTAFHDMMENGMNLQNTLLAIAGIMAAGIGIGIMTGSWIPLLIAGIASLLLAIVYFTGHGGELIDGLKTLCQGFIDFFAGVFTGDWERAWEGIKNVGKGAVNVLISIVNSMIDLVVRGLNMLSFDVPSWVPGIGGNRVGFNIQNAPQIPYLAQGAVIPPNREFLAVLGDQKHGNNIEAPEDLIRKIVREESGNGNNAKMEALLEDLISVVEGIEVGDDVIGKAAARYNRSASRARGC